MRHRRFGRSDLRWVVLLAGVFVYLLALTKVRVEYREQTTRIERLERILKEKTADEAFLGVSIKRACTYGIVEEMAAQEWGMAVAGADQRVRVETPAALHLEDLAEADDSGLWKQVRGYLPGGVKEARASAGGGRDRGAQN